MVKNNNKKKEVKDKILVIGDVMVDMYTDGNVNRISPEAPVPILEATDVTTSLGGAANVAKNLTSFDVDTYLMGYIANDWAGRKFTEMIKDSNIRTKMFKSRTTTLKQRYGYPQILRVDLEEKVNAKKREIYDMIRFIKKINPSIIIISDYAKGCISQSLFNEIINLNKEMKFKLLVDPKPKNDINYKGCFLMTPNLKEAIEFCPKKSLRKIGLSLVKKYGCNVIITRGENGMDLFTRKKCSHTPSMAKEVYNVSGAGDAVIASLGYSILKGCQLNDAMNFANEIAADTVSNKSTSIQVNDSFLNKVNKIKNE